MGPAGHTEVRPPAPLRAVDPVARLRHPTLARVPLGRIIAALAPLLEPAARDDGSSGG